MGYDNECIVNIQSLPGEYFCPVCRTLVYPNDALQAQCTHLYCKPCLAYVVATTHACPYDGYLVTEADSKPLVEYSKELADTIGKVSVHCLYHRSGCQWQGTLAESTAHGTECSYGNSPVVCNRCGTQIIHRQVQEHAQICPGIQPQGQVAENMQAQAAPVASQAASQDPTSVAAIAAAPTAAPASTGAPTVPATAAPASAPAAVSAAPGHVQAPTPEQWYQQQQAQYQQYYQQYPGYDPYQQQFQQYAQYQQQGYPQQYMQPQMQAAPQPYMQQPQPGQLQGQPMPHPQPQAQVVQPQLQQPHHPQPQPLQPHAQPQPVAGQVPQMQAQPPLVPPQQPQTHPYPQPQLQPQVAQARPPQLQAPPQHQQPVPPQQLPQHSQPRPQYPFPQPQPQLQQPSIQMQPQGPQPQPHHQAQPVPQMQPPAHPVSGYQSYPQPIPGPAQQRPMHMPPQQQGIPPQHLPQPQSQFPAQQLPQMRPSHSQMPMPAQQPPAMPPPQGLRPNLHPSQQQVQHTAHQPGQQVYQQPSMQPHAQQHGFPQPQVQSQMPPGPPQHQIQPQQSLRPQGPTYMQQSVPGHPHPQMNAPPAHGLPPHQPHARPTMANQGMPQQHVPHSPNQSYMGRAASQSGPVQQSQPPHSGSQGGLVPASPATLKQGASPLDTIGQGRHAEGSKSSEKISEHTNESKPKGEESEAAAEVKVEDGQTENDNKDVSQDNVNGPLVKAVKVEDGSNMSSEVAEGSHAFKTAGGEKEIPGHESKYDDKRADTHPVSDKSLQRESQRSNLERTSQGYSSDGQNAGNVNKMHPSQQMHLTHQNAFPSQFPQRYPGTEGHQGMPPGPPPSNQERYPPGPPQQIPYGHHPQMSDPTMACQRPPAQPMHQSGRFPEPCPSHTHVHGPPSQMRPPESLWPAPYAGAPATGLPPPPGVTSHQGFPPKGFEQQIPQGQGHSHLPPPPMARPPAGAGDAPSGMMGGHPFMPEDRTGKSPAFNAMEAEARALNRPDGYDGRQIEPHRPPATQPHLMKMNGMANNVPVGGMHDSSFSRGLPEDRFRPFPEEGLNPAHDEHLMSGFNPGRNFVNRRDFNEDLKQFPRPAHLDGEGPPRFDGYSSSSRPLPSYPPGVDGSEVHRDIGNRDRSFPPDRLNRVPEFSRHRMDGLPPLRSPGHFSRDIPNGPPNQPRRGLDGLGNFSDGRGNEVVASQNYPNFLRGGGVGGFREHDLHGMPSGLRIGDPGFNGRFDVAAHEGEIDRFEQSKKRKVGSMVRCLICKIDCETVEGLELHSHSREHQKMAMDMVLSIKKENAKKHKSNSENAFPFEDGNKSRKASFEKRANRQ